MLAGTARKVAKSTRLCSYARGGFDTPVRGTMFVRDGAVTPGPSRDLLC